MYAETGVMLPYFQCFSQEVQHLEEFCRSQSSNVPLGNLVQASTISDYDFWGEGDLFKAPETVIEEPTLEIDPLTAAISMISCGEDIRCQTLGVTDLESIQNGQMLSEVFYECEKDLLAKDAIETPLPEIMDIKIPIVGENDGPIPEHELFSEGSFAKSVSSDCLSAMELGHQAPMGPTFLDIPRDDLATVYVMRRAYSEGDIKALGSNNVNLIHSPCGPPQYAGNCLSEERMQKLSRYRNKRTKRNYGQKIKYARRKALAESQPRVRGRFAKTEELK